MLITFLRESSKFSKFTQNLIKNLPLNPTQLKQRRFAADTKSGTGAGTGTTTANATAVPPAATAPKQCDPQKKKSDKLYNTPHPPKDPPENYAPLLLNHNAFFAPECLPCAIFRPFGAPDEKLGPNASKCNPYKNPEYYSYHRYSFVEIQRNVLELRAQRIKDDGARVVYDYESGAEEELLAGTKQLHEDEGIEKCREKEESDSSSSSSGSSSSGSSSSSSSSSDEESKPGTDGDCKK